MVHGWRRLGEADRIEEVPEGGGRCLALEEMAGAVDRLCMLPVYCFQGWPYWLTETFWKAERESSWSAGRTTKQKNNLVYGVSIFMIP